MGNAFCNLIAKTNYSKRRLVAKVANWSISWAISTGDRIYLENVFWIKHAEPIQRINRGVKTASEYLAELKLLDNLHRLFLKWSTTNIKLEPHRNCKCSCDSNECIRFLTLVKNSYSKIEIILPIICRIFKNAWITLEVVYNKETSKMSS